MAWELGNTVPLSITVTDDVGDPVDAASVTLTITGPDGVVGGTNPLHAGTGFYEFDFVPTVPGLYRVRWTSTGPATAVDDVADVRASFAGVVSLRDAKLHLNKDLGVTVDDDELRPMIAAAVDRVDRHLYTAAQRASGVTLAAKPAVTEAEVLAVKTALVEFWKTQRVKWAGGGGGAGGGTATAVLQDTGPAGAASLTVRLTELLGPAAADDGLVPVGSFPDAQSWPDPAVVISPWRTYW